MSVPESKSVNEVPPKNESQKEVDDDDFDDLDDLLDDFANDILDKPPGSEGVTPGTQGQSQAQGQTQNHQGQSNNINLSKEVEDSQANIQDLLDQMTIEDPEARKQFESLLEQLKESTDESIEAQSINQQNKTAQPNFNNVVKETMERLKENGNKVDASIKNEQPEELLSQLLQGLDMSGEGDFDMSKLLVDMLNQLSSKEILYEPIKDLSNKYPKWLKDNKAKITPAEYTSYTNQLNQVNKILEIFDNPKYDDNNEVLRNSVNENIEILQGLGQPPKELIGDGIPGLSFDDDEIPEDLDGALDDNCKQT